MQLTHTIVWSKMIGSMCLIPRGGSPSFFSYYAHKVYMIKNISYFDRESSRTESFVSNEKKHVAWLIYDMLMIWIDLCVVAARAKDNTATILWWHAWWVSHGRNQLSQLRFWILTSQQLTLENFQFISHRLLNNHINRIDKLAPWLNSQSPPTDSPVCLQ